MRVLVVGRTGQVARSIAFLDPTPVFLGREDLDLSEARVAVDAVADRSPDVVINAAAYTAVDQAESETELAMAVNARAVGEIAEGAAAAGAALIHLSTDYVYSGMPGRPHRETDAPRPVNAYAEAKLAGEHAALAANPRTVVLRTSWVYAPWGRNFVRTMLRLGAARDSLRVVADQRGQPTSALDIARVCLALAPRLAAAAAADPVWGAYNYAGRPATDWASFAARIVARAEGRLIPRAPSVERIATADYPTPARRPENSEMDLSRIEAVFGVMPRDWQEALDEVMDMIDAEDLAQ